VQDRELADFSPPGAVPESSQRVFGITLMGYRRFAHRVIGMGCRQGFNPPMPATTPLASITVPLGGQLLELQEIVHAEGAMPLLRVRIREGKRFTVLDIDALSARRWGEVMLAWAGRQADGRP
jgi:hypothetical protein